MRRSIAKQSGSVKRQCKTPAGRLMAPRVLCVYGSEGGTAKSALKKLANEWKAEGVNVSNIIEGNSVGALGSLSEEHDVIVVATSSFGEGDPPENFWKFALSLLQAVNKQEKPLAGMQHAVLGYGSSTYPTYQNMPRLVDKLMEECGSRRFVQRAECDDSSEDDPAVVRKKFASECSAAFKQLPKATAPPKCAWTQPESTILEKTEDELSLGFSPAHSGYNPIRLSIRGQYSNRSRYMRTRSLYQRRPGRLGLRLGLDRARSRCLGRCGRRLLLLQ